MWSNEQYTTVQPAQLTVTVIGLTLKATKEAARTAFAKVLERDVAELEVVFLQASPRGQTLRGEATHWAFDFAMEVK